MTRFSMRAALITASLAGAGLLGGCTDAAMMGGACPAVPPAQAEPIPPPPPSGERQTWQPGDWTYVSGQFVWEPGHFIPAAPGQGGWVPGSFAPAPNNPCAWVPAHWVS